MFYPTYEEFGIFKPDNLINGKFAQIRAFVPLAKDQGLLKRGTVLGKITDKTDPQAGKYKKVSKSAKDGSKEPTCILADDIDTAKKFEQVAFLTGEFNLNAIDCGDLDKEDLKESLRKFAIFLSESQKCEA
jgi:Bacteriophage lambda head decoration protein D